MKFIDAREARPLDDEELDDGQRRALAHLEAALTAMAEPAQQEDRHRGTPVADRDRMWRARIHAARRNRILLISGDRGSGKTSLLVTLIDRFKEPDRLGLSILDFDPLPPGLPLLAWLMTPILKLCQALDRPEDRRSGYAQSSCDDPCAPRGPGSEVQPLGQRAHALLQDAIRGWTSGSGDGRSSSEQVLDRHEQVEDWYALTCRWETLLDEVLSRLERQNRLRFNTGLLVAAIDDLDMQTSRIPEALHAIRLLYHPRLVWVLTAHEPQIFQMLEAEYENRLPPVPKGIAKKLPEALLAKTIPEHHRAHLSPVSLRWILDRSPQGLKERLAGLVTLKAVGTLPAVNLRGYARLNEWTQAQEDTQSEGFVGRWLEQMVPRLQRDARPNWQGAALKLRPAEGEAKPSLFSQELLQLPGAWQLSAPGEAPKPTPLPSDASARMALFLLEALARGLVDAGPRVVAPLVQSLGIDGKPGAAWPDVPPLDDTAALTRWFELWRVRPPQTPEALFWTWLHLQVRGSAEVPPEEERTKLLPDGEAALFKQGSTLLILVQDTSGLPLAFRRDLRDRLMAKLTPVDQRNHVARAISIAGEIPSLLMRHLRDEQGRLQSLYEFLRRSLGVSWLANLRIDATDERVTLGFRLLLNPSGPEYGLSDLTWAGERLLDLHERLEASPWDSAMGLGDPASYRGVSGVVAFFHSVAEVQSWSAPYTRILRWRDEAELAGRLLESNIEPTQWSKTALDEAHDLEVAHDWQVQLGAPPEYELCVVLLLQTLSLPVPHPIRQGPIRLTLGGVALPLEPLPRWWQNELLRLMGRQIQVRLDQLKPQPQALVQTWLLAAVIKALSLAVAGGQRPSDLPPFPAPSAEVLTAWRKLPPELRDTLLQALQAAMPQDPLVIELTDARGP
jgi:hypothetical protein